MGIKMVWISGVQTIFLVVIQINFDQDMLYPFVALQDLLIYKS